MMSKLFRSKFSKSKVRYRDLRTLRDLNKDLLEELEHFFVSYNEMRGKKFKLIGGRGPKRAFRDVDKASRNHRRK